MNTLPQRTEKHKDLRRTNESLSSHWLIKLIKINTHWAQKGGREKKEAGWKAPEGFEPSISCLLDRRFNQLSHGAHLLTIF